MVLVDAGDRLADRAGDTDSSTFGCGGGSSATTTEAERARQLSNEEVAFGVGLRGSFGVAGGARLLDVVVDLGETSAVGLLGSRMEDLARVADWRARQVDRLAAVDRHTGPGLGGDEIQYMVLPARVGEEPR